MAARFWIKATNGIFNNTAHWSATSGGGGGSSVPGASDDVNFDANGLGDCQFDIAISVQSIVAVAGYTATIDAATDDLNHAVSGDVTLDNSRVDMGDGTWTVGGNWDNRDVTTFNRNSSTLVLNGTTKTIIASKLTLLNNVTIDGSYTLDATTSVEMIVEGALLINSGKSLTLDEQLAPKGTCTIFGTLTINATRDINIADAGSLLVKTGGTLDGAGQAQIINGGDIAEQSGTYNVATTLTRKTATVAGGTYGGTWTNKSNSAIHNLTLGNGASQTLIFTGNVTFEAQDFDFNLNNNTNNPNIEFQGNVTVNETGAGGTFNWNKGTGTITINKAGDQTITFFSKSVEDTIIAGSGNKTFNDGATWGTFTFADSGVTAHKFEAGKTFQFDTTLNSNGTAGTRSIIRSTIDATTYNFNLQGTSNFADKVDVKDSDAGTGNEIDAPGSIDSGNNFNWNFLDEDGPTKDLVQNITSNLVSNLTD